MKMKQEKSLLEHRGFILSRTEKENLTNGVYRYKCVNEALLEPYITPFWNFLARNLPVWVHPNVLTLVGSLSLLPAFFLYAYYSWSMESEDVPLSVWMLAVLGIFLFQTLDNLDGKQARRLGLSSPIGDWFDHSLDILSLYLLISQVVTAIYHGATYHPIDSIFAQLAPAVMHFFVFWDRRWTRELYIGPMSITEGQFVIMLVLTLGPVFGRAAWTTPRFGDYTAGDFVAWIAAGIFTIISPLGIILRVIFHPERKDSLVTIFLRVLDIVVVYAGSMAWAWYSSTTVSNTRLMMWAVGLSASNVATSMLMSALMQGKNRGIIVAILPWIGALNSYLGSPVPDFECTVAILTAALSIQLYLLCGTLHDMRGHLNYRLFHVNAEVQRRVEAEEKAAKTK